MAGCVVPPSNMLNWWAGDGTAKDIQGGRNGTLQNGAGFAPGKVDQAFSLDGVNDYVDVGDVDLPATFTIDAWINPTNITSSPYILNKDLAPQRSYWFSLDRGKMRGVVANSAGGFTQYLTVNPVVVAGSWQFVAMTDDGNAAAGQKIKFYLNGVNVPAVIGFPGQDAGGTPDNNPLTTKIGIQGAGVQDPFGGLIDELETFSRVLPATELQQIFTAGSAGKCKPTPTPTPTPSPTPSPTPTPIPTPANNDFANAQVVSGLIGTATGTNFGASKQAGEPNHGGNAGGGSVWYRWQAPGSGSAFFNTLGSDFDTLLGIYTGSSVNALTLVGDNDNFVDRDIGYIQSQVRFDAIAATVYYIAVDGKAGVTGNIALRWGVSTPTPTPTPAPGATIHRINSGGPEVAPFSADNFVTGGGTFSTTASINTSGVANPAPSAVYQSERFGNFTYTFPGLTPGATYTARLHFAQIFHTSPGQRAFNVAINGGRVLDGYDIVADAGGANKAVVREFVTTANSGGQIIIVYTPFTENPSSSGIEIIAGGTLGGTPTPTPTPGGGPPGLTADYQFQNTRNSSAGGPALTDIITGPNGANSFATESVEGCAPPTVMNFPKGNGLTLAPTTGVTTDNKTYSIAVLFKFTEQGRNRAIVDFENGMDGRGVYADAENNLNFFNSFNNGPGISVGSGSPFTTNRYVQVVLTRQGGDGNAGRAGIDTGYVNGVQQYRLDNFNDDGILLFNTLRFFLNQLTGDQFYSAGTVARIRLFNRALTGAEVAALDRLPGGACTSPSPTPTPSPGPTPTPGPTPPVCTDGALDPTFNVTGRVAGDPGTGNAMAMQPDGKFIVAGSVTVGSPGSFVTRFAVARYLPNGTLDASFGTNGAVSPQFSGFGYAEGRSVAIASDGKIVVAGRVISSSPTSANHSAVARYTSSGTLDASFGNGGTVVTEFFSPDSSAAEGVAIQADGKIVTVGRAEMPGSSNTFIGLARYTLTGALDTGFDTDGKVTTAIAGYPYAIPSAMAIQSDGKIVSAGRANTSGPSNYNFALDDFMVAWRGTTQTALSIRALEQTDR